jgi:pyruvate dehydrogenase E2 component (dihydrolipoamide acetyltransferase)
MPDVQMPRLSDSMETGKIVRWLKKEGDQVKKGEPLVEIESDKANIEVEAYASGPLSKIVVKEGDSAPIGAVIAQIGADGGALKAEQPTPAAAAAKPEPVKTTAPTPAAPAGGGEQYPQGGVDDRVEAGAAAQAALQSIRRKPASEGDGERVKASPVARRLAQEMGVDLSGVEGTGPGGRITREDVEAARGSDRTAAPPLAAAPASAPPSPTAPPAVRRPTEPVEVVELSKMQATVAMRLTQSFAAPHFYVTTEIAMEDAVHFRESFNESVGKDEAISFNDLIVKAVAMALTRFPEVNSSWADGRIERKRDINIGIAVNVPDGLIVPVLRNADQKSLQAIGVEARALIERARTKKGHADDYLGNTFSVSNLGAYDVDQFTAVINPPDSAILAVGSIQDKPVVKGGAVVPGKRMRVTLSVDHRVIYGVTAAQFLEELKRRLEHPISLVIG